MITDGRELFGSVTLQPPSATPNGYSALAVFDDPGAGGNGDGWITSADAVFNRLRLWLDISHDGISQPTELHKLSEYGIDKVSLRYHESKYVDENGNVFRYRAKIDDREPLGRWTYDVFLMR